MKDAFDDGFFTRLDTAEERISELQISEDLSTETYKNWNEKRKKTKKTQNRITKNLGIKDVICNVNSRRRKRGAEELSEAMMTEDALKSMSDTKPQIQESQRTPSLINAQQKEQKSNPNELYLDIPYSGAENQR